jgi:hypothetical protein
MELPEIQRAIEALPAESRASLLVWLQETAGARPARFVRKSKPKAPVTLQRAVLWSVLSLLAFVAADSAIFRSGWYLNYLEPNSTTGQLEAQLFWLRHEKPKGIPEAAVLGDSRIAEGFSARKATAVSGDKIRFWNLGVSGSTPRAWYYLLRDGDPTHSRFKAIAFGIDHYSDQDGPENVANRITDLNYLIGRLRLVDCLDFARSFPSAELQRPVLTGCLFKGVTLRRDVQSLLANRKERFAAAKDWRNNGHGYIDGYGGKPEDLTGLTADFEKRTLNFPDGAKDWQKSTALATVFPSDAPQTGQLTEYRKLWLGRIVELYKDSPTQLIFLELPRAPFPTPDMKAPARFFDSIRNRPRITILPKETFRDLEHPEVFADGLHLNHVGRPIFSERLAQKMTELVGAN